MLFVTPYFFGYEEQIALEFERQGWGVTIVDERPSNHSLMRAVFRVRPALAWSRIRNYYRKILDRLVGKEFDLILVVKGEVVPLFFIDELRTRYPAARIVGYTFDSVVNSPRFQVLSDRFDASFSFDRKDASSHGFKYLPLFHAPNFQSASRSLRQNEICFVGSLHSDRYRLAKTIARDSPAFLFFYVPAYWYFFFIKYLTKAAHMVSWSEVSFKSLTLAEVADAFGTARCVIDVPRVGQQGLTMRTFEALAAGALLATTNAAIREEPFFDPARIVIFDERDPEAARTLIADACRAWAHDPNWVASQLSNYSIANWVGAVSGTRASLEGRGFGQ